MKKFLALAALYISLHTFAQISSLEEQRHIIDSINALPQGPVKTTLDIPVDSSTGKIKFTAVVDAPGKKAATILSSVNAALLKSNAFTDKTIIISDTTTGEFTMRCTSPLQAANGGNLCFINYLLTVYAKDGRFKYILTNFVHEGCDRPGLPRMISTGELENALVSTAPNRGYYDNMLVTCKTTAEAVINEIKAGVLKSDDRNF